MKQIVIIGGVAGGASAATRARRVNEDARITMLERGPYVSYANCGLPYYVGGEIEDQQDLLLETPESFRDRFNIDVHIQTNVTHVDAASRKIQAEGPDGPETLSYDELILAPGSVPIRVPIPGSDLANVYHLRTVPDALRLRDYLKHYGIGRAVVLGAGFIGIEITEMLLRQGVEVVLVDLAPQILPPFDRDIARAMEDRMRNEGVQIRLNQSIDHIIGAGWVSAVRLTTGDVVSADMVVLALGVRPDVSLAQKAGLRLGQTGAIWVDARMQTSNPHIYAAGDAVEKVNLVTGRRDWWPLAGVANKEGRVAGTNAAGGQAELKGALGTAIVRFNPWSVGLTGLTEKRAKQLGIPYSVGYTLRGHHAGYYPGAKDLLMKVVYDPETGRLLGAQAMGQAGVDKRIDIIATALYAKIGIHDLAQLDLAYAPPFGAAKDPAVIAGMAAENNLENMVESLTPESLKDWLQEYADLGPVLIDVRDSREIQLTGGIGDFQAIPLNSLRGELPRLERFKSQPVVVYCRSGHRSYVAARILMQRGFSKVYNLAGGYTAWDMYQDNAS